MSFRGVIPKLDCTRTRVAIVLALCFGAALVTFVSNKTYNNAQAATHVTQKSQADRWLKSVEMRLKSVRLALFGLQAFLENSETVTREEWSSYTNRINSRHERDKPFAFAYIRRSDPHCHDDISRYAARLGYADYSIWQKPTALEVGPFLAAVVHMAPDEIAEGVRGLDVSGSGNARDALKRAALSGRVGITGRERLAYAGGYRYGVVAYLAIYEEGFGPQSVDPETLEGVSGWVAVPIVMETYLAGAERHMPAACHIRTYISGPDGDDTKGLTQQTFIGGWKSASCSDEEAGFENHADRMELGSDGQEIIVEVPIGDRKVLCVVGKEPSTHKAIMATLPATFIALLGAGLFVWLVGSLAGTRDRAEALALDMTATVRAREELLAETGRLARIGGWEIDLLTDEITWSDEVRAIHEVGDDYVPDLASAIAFYPGDAARYVEEAVARAIEHNEPWDFESPFRTAKGRDIWVRALGRVECDASGKPVRLWGAFQDITRSREVRDELERAREQAVAASTAKSAFLANMSHEIRTPMNAIIGFTEVLAEEDLPADQRTAHLKTIRSNGEHLLSLISDVLDMSKIEAGKLTIEERSLDIPQLLRETCDLFGQQAQKKGLGFKLDIDTSAQHTFRSDPTRLRQIVSNLLSNAVKFTSEGSVRVRAHWAEETLTIAVEDSGIGMTPEQASNIFDAFGQADASTTRRFGGTGLGLCIARSLAQRLGGDLVVSSEPGQGSTFTLSIRAERCSVSPTQAAPAGPAGSTDLTSARVLIVDDGPDNRRLIAHHLRKAGIAFETAHDGVECIEAVRAEQRAGGRFDLIFMDMQMPRLDGYDATRRLRSEGYTGRIVALTAHAMGGDREKCLEAGCDDYMTKPAKRDLLIGAVEAARHAYRRAA